MVSFHFGIFSKWKHFSRFACAVKPLVNKQKPLSQWERGTIELHPNRSRLADLFDYLRRHHVGSLSGQVRLGDDADEPIRATSFASERPSRSGSGEGFFSFLFGN